MSWRGRKPAGRNWGGSLKPFKTETGVTVRTVQAGDGIAHKIYDGKTYVGHISGFPDIRDSLRVYKTQVEDEHHERIPRRCARPQRQHATATVATVVRIAAPPATRRARRQHVGSR
jgi:hypothetical protein